MFMTGLGGIGVRITPRVRGISNQLTPAPLNPGVKTMIFFEEVRLEAG